uniref:Protein phosphatase 1 regulatory subunit 36 n=1 Tax=Mastacembelus armatus TaxID=205130 RepID=A0A7N8YLU4_9TELE
MCVLNHRGRQSLGNSLSPAHLDTYRSSVMKRRGDCVTLDDVKRKCLNMLLKSVRVTTSSLSVSRSKELDDVLATLLLYLSCFFEHKSLENKPKHLMTLDLIPQHQLKAEPLAKKEIAKRKLAVCYFTLVMHLEIEQMASHTLLYLSFQSLYSFFCYVAWVTFGRKDLRDIQDEVGRLLYSDTFNTAVGNRTDGDSELTSTVSNGSLKMGDADPKEIKCSGTFKQRQVKFGYHNICPDTCLGVHHIKYL